MKKVLAIAGMALGALLLVIVAIGMILPGEWKIERSIVVNATQEQVHAVLDSRDGWRDMMSWSEKQYPDQTMVPGGPPDRGAGLEMQWIMGGSTHTVTITRSEPPKYVGYTLEMVKPDITLDGHFKLAKEGVGTKVTWIETGEIGANPFARIVASAMKRGVEADFDSGLASLKRVVEDRAHQAVKDQMAGEAQAGEAAGGAPGEAAGEK